MTDIIQTIMAAVLATVVAGLLLYHFLLRRRFRKSGEKLDESYQSFYDALKQLVDVAEPEKQRSVVASDQERWQHQRNVGNLAARHRLRRTWSPVPQAGSIGVRADAPSPVANVNPSGRCPMCGSVKAEIGLVDLVGRQRTDSTVGRLYTYAGVTVEDRYPAGLLSAALEEELGIISVGVYHNRGYSEQAVYLGDEAYVDHAPYATVW